MIELKSTIAQARHVSTSYDAQSADKVLIASVKNELQVAFRYPTTDTVNRSAPGSGRRSITPFVQIQAANDDESDLMTPSTIATQRPRYTRYTPQPVTSMPRTTLTESIQRMFPAEGISSPSVLSLPDSFAGITVEQDAKVKLNQLAAEQSQQVHESAVQPQKVDDAHISAHESTIRSPGTTEFQSAHSSPIGTTMLFDESQFQHRRPSQATSTPFHGAVETEETSHTSVTTTAEALNQSIPVITAKRLANRGLRDGHRR